MSDRTTGQTQTIRARYLIAADEATSPIREQLGIPRHGVGHLRMLRSVLFRCPEADEALRDVRFYSLLPESGQAEIHPERSFGLRPNPAARIVVGCPPKRPSGNFGSMWLALRPLTRSAWGKVAPYCDGSVPGRRYANMCAT